MADKNKYKPILLPIELYNKVEEIRAKEGFRTLTKALALILEEYSKNK